MSWQKYFDWLNMGIDNGWISEPVCFTHEGFPMSEEEETAWEEGYDPCIPAIRLYGNEFIFDDDEDDRHPVM